MKKCMQIVFLGLLVVLLYSLLSCDSKPVNSPSGNGAAVQKQAESTLDKVKKTRVLKAGFCRYPPYVAVDPGTGKASGFYIDLIEEVAKLMEVKIEYHESNWGTMITDLKTGKYDVQVAPIFRTIPRAMEVTFTRPIGYFGNGFVVKKDDKRFHSPYDLNKKGIKIAVTQGEVGHEFAKKNLPNAKLIVIKTGDISRPLLDVIAGRADAGIADAWTVYQFIEAHKDSVEDPTGGKPFNIVSASWFVRQGDPTWFNFLNTSIDFLESSGVIDQLAAKYKAPSFREKKQWTSGLW